MAKKAKKKSARTRKKAARKAATARTSRVAPSATPRTKSDVFGTIADSVGISKKEVAAVFETMGDMIGKDLSKRGSGQFTVPGLMKVTVKRKPATKARKGINPFTGEPTVFKAKPARNVVKIRPMKGLKDMVA